MTNKAKRVCPIKGSGGGSAEGAVSYAEEQSLNKIQKDRARLNIGAAEPVRKVTEIPTDDNYLPNVLYVLTLDDTARTVSLAASLAGLAAEYHLLLTIGASAPTIMWPVGLTWKGGSAPAIDANHVYEISILENLAVCEDWGAVS